MLILHSLLYELTASKKIKVVNKKYNSSNTSILTDQTKLQNKTSFVCVRLEID